MIKQIHSDWAPAAIGTYSQAIQHGELVFLSGQIALCPQTMQLCSDEITAQIEQVFVNLSAVCVAAGGTIANVVKLNVYLTDLGHFPLINEAMTRYFNAPYPARAVIGVSALPRGALVEVDGLMVLAKAS